MLATRHSIRNITITATVLLLLVTGSPVATAQEPGNRVRVPADVHSQPVSLPERPEVATIGEALGFLTILVDGASCGQVDLDDPGSRDSNGDAVGALQTTDQCSRDGGTVSFVDGNGLSLAETFTLRPGEEIVLANLAPEPPGRNGVPPLPPGTGTGTSAGKGGNQEWASVLLLTSSLAAVTFAVLRKRPR